MQPARVAVCPSPTTTFTRVCAWLAGHRDRLEHICRYALRPPLTEERLTRPAIRAGARERIENAISP